MLLPELGAISDPTDQDVVGAVFVWILEQLAATGSYQSDWRIDIDDNGRVVGIDFSGLGLAGPIPPELGYLTDVTYLDLSDNELTGPVPPELGNLKRLWRLHIDGNRLDGEIPYSFLGLETMANHEFAEFSFDTNAELCIPRGLKNGWFHRREHPEC